MRYLNKSRSSKKTANALLSSGIVKGDRVAVCMANNPEYNKFIWAVCWQPGIRSIEFMVGPKRNYLWFGKFRI